MSTATPPSKLEARSDVYLQPQKAQASAGNAAEISDATFEEAGAKARYRWASIAELFSFVVGRFGMVGVMGGITFGTSATCSSTSSTR